MRTVQICRKTCKTSLRRAPHGCAAPLWWEFCHIFAQFAYTPGNGTLGQNPLVVCKYMLHPWQGLHKKETYFSRHSYLLKCFVDKQVCLNEPHNICGLIGISENYPIPRTPTLILDISRWISGVSRTAVYFALYDRCPLEWASCQYVFCNSAFALYETWEPRHKMIIRGSLNKILPAMPIQSKTIVNRYN